MTSLEHVSVKHALDRFPSWAEDVDGDRRGDRVELEVRGEVAVEVEEVGVGVAVTTDDDEGEERVGIPVGPHSLHPGDESRGEDGFSRDQDKVEERGRGGDGSGLGSTSAHSGASQRSRRASALGSARSRSPTDSNSNSPSPSPSSTRGPLGMGESSAATSWTQADAEGTGPAGRPSGDGNSRRRTSEDERCRSSAEQLELEGEESGDSAVPREAVSPSQVRTGMDGNAGGEGGDASRKEEVIVMQEEDIAEGWHPLRYTGKARSHYDGEEESVKGEVEEDLGSARPLGSEHGGDQSLEMNEKDRWRTFGSSASGSRRDVRHLRLEFKQASPQPWDDTDPPTDTNEMYASDYYSTLNSKKFGTLQKSRRRPPIPHSTYYFGPPPPDSAYGTPPAGQIGVHHPREIVRVERDYAGGELTQFSPVFPLELEGRITPTQFHQTINDINEILISAHSIRHAFLNNFLAVVTLQLSTLMLTSHYTKEMRRLKLKIEELNTQLYNPVGLNILWPRKVAFLFLEIEYY